MMDGYWHDGGSSWGAWLGMGVVMLLLASLVGVAVTLLLRGRREPGDVASTLLAERFARGDIDQEEYLERRTLLQSGR